MFENEALIRLQSRITCSANRHSAFFEDEYSSPFEVSIETFKCFLHLLSSLGVSKGATMTFGQKNEIEPAENTDCTCTNWFGARQMLCGLGVLIAAQKTEAHFVQAAGNLWACRGRAENHKTVVSAFKLCMCTSTICVYNRTSRNSRPIRNWKEKNLTLFRTWLRIAHFMKP